MRPTVGTLHNNKFFVCRWTTTRYAALSACSRRTRAHSCRLSQTRTVITPFIIIIIIINLLLLFIHYVIRQHIKHTKHIKIARPKKYVPTTTFCTIFYSVFLLPFTVNKVMYNWQSALHDCLLKLRLRRGDWNCGSGKCDTGKIARVENAGVSRMERQPEIKLRQSLATSLYLSLFFGLNKL